MSDYAPTNSNLPGAGRFATTHWSVVMAAGRPKSASYQQALETLCRTYWFPLYAYLRRQGYDSHGLRITLRRFLPAALASPQDT